MRKILMMMALGSLLSSSVTNAQDGNERQRIKGSGKITTREVQVGSFDQLNISGAFNVVLAQGAKEDIKVEVEDNLQELILVDQSNHTLTISTKKNVEIRTDKKMTVYVTFKQLKGLDLKTVGNVSSEGTLNFDEMLIRNKSVGNVDLSLTAQSLTLQNKSVGNLELQGKAEKAVVMNKSVGNFKASKFVVQSMDIDNEGIGNAEVNAAKILKLKSSGLGKVKNKGAAKVTRQGKVEI